ncbi:hypothetical protein MTP99_011849 [Tenebrio molitor]|jgi:hypothetical protein|nr:hypothetical protein MTP99_011849 [Tenebrio molitor]UXO98145.1 insulin like peptide 2 [Tenebrio molitor]WVD93538.1 insulin-like peptide [Tenebrio molitor]CAH1370290.1 unnamed protein product [Tenebrio molitor]
MDLQCVFVVVVATVLAALHTCTAEDVATIRGSQNNKKIYCGTRLSETLSAVCKGNYNTLNKKSDIYSLSKSNVWGGRHSSDSYRPLDYPYRSKASASSLITTFRQRRRRGVFNECCEKPCSHEELSSYCGNSK